MKKLLGLLGTIMIAGNAIPSVIAAAPNRKHSIKKRQNNENTSTTPKTKDDQQPQFLTTSDSKVDIIEKKITLDESYSESIQKILKELIKNNQIDPLRMINNEGIITTEISKKEREENIKILEKLDVILELSKFDENKIRILVLSVKNNTNLIKIVINLNNLYVIGLINNENQYFYFKEEDEKQEKDRIKLEEDIKKIDPKNKSTKTKYDKIKKRF